MDGKGFGFIENSDGSGLSDGFVMMWCVYDGWRHVNRGVPTPQNNGLIRFSNKALLRETNG